MKQEAFLENLKEKKSQIVDRIRKADSIHLISHLDADGISSAAIIAKTLERLGKSFYVTIVKQLREKVINELEGDYDLFIFTDLGTGQLDLIKDLNKPTIVLDHHELKGHEIPDFVTHINPREHGLEEGKASASTVTYLVSKTISDNNIDLSTLALVGAIGDHQMKGDSNGLNEIVVKDARSHGLLKVEKGLRFFGRYTKPVHKALEYSTDPYIPGVSGSESRAVQFLKSEVGLELRDNGEFRRFVDLTEEEKQKLATRLIYRRIDGEKQKPEDIFGDLYTFPNKKGLLEGAEEFSTLLNACGKNHKPYLGLLIAMGHKSLDEAQKALYSYKRELVKYLNKVKDEEVPIERKDKLFIVHGGGEIPDTMIGTVCSIASGNESITKKPIVLGFADRNEENLKASIRTDEYKANELAELADELGGQGGGHKRAAGFEISKEKKQELLKRLKEKLKSD